MTDNDGAESTRQSPRDFDAIEINIRINDEIVTGEEFRHDSMISEEEIEASKHDSVEMHTRTMVDGILRRYKEYREDRDD